jgi:3-keto-5-aminohexanoate cleavage enzyme
MKIDRSKIVINFTPTGMVPMKRDTPHVPLSCDEIVEDVHKAVQLGITIVHLHVRDEFGVPGYRKEYYQDIIQQIRQFAPELVICVSTSGRLFNEFEKRSDVLDLSDALKPDMATLTLSSLNFLQGESVNSPKMIQDLVSKMNLKGILPELEVFDVGMINYANYLIKKGLLTAPHYFNLIMGNIASSQAKLGHLNTMIEELPALSYFSIGGLGNHQLSMNGMAIAMGYGIRIGLEDNIFYDDQRVQLASNHTLLERAHRIIAAHDKTHLSSSEFRSMFNLHNDQINFGVKNSE